MFDGIPNRSRLGSTIFMLKGHGELKIAWNEDKHEEAIAAIQEKMDQGVAFHILDPDSKAKNPGIAEIENTNQITGREVYVRDADIAKLVQGGIGSIAHFTGMAELKTVGKAKTAAEAAAKDTVAVAPKQGG